MLSGRRHLVTFHLRKPNVAVCVTTGIPRRRLWSEQRGNSLIGIALCRKNSYICMADVEIGACRRSRRYASLRIKHFSRVPTG